MNHPRVYSMLKRIGHSPLKALEILTDARRGDAHALSWVRAVFSLRLQADIDSATGRR